MAYLLQYLSYEIYFYTKHAMSDADGVVKFEWKRLELLKLKNKYYKWWLNDRFIEWQNYGQAEI